MQNTHHGCTGRFKCTLTQFSWLCSVIYTSLKLVVPSCPNKGCQRGFAEITLCCMDAFQKKAPCAAWMLSKSRDCNVQHLLQDFVGVLSVFSKRASRDDRLRFIFNVYDMDGDGHVAAEDLELMLRQLAGRSLRYMHASSWTSSWTSSWRQSQHGHCY